MGGGSRRPPPLADHGSFGAPARRGLTCNKNKTFVNKSCFVFLLYRGICRFCAISGRFGGMTAFDPFGYAFEGHGFEGQTSVNRLKADLQSLLNWKDNVCIDYFQKSMQIPPLHRQIISQIQTKRFRVKFEAVWLAPAPGLLPGLRATQTPPQTPHPWLKQVKLIMNGVIIDAK